MSKPEHEELKEKLQSEGGVSSAVAEKLLEYAESLIEINQVTNLTGAKTVEDFVLKQIMDTLLAIKVFNGLSSQLPPPSIVYDVGSGSGVPGIILAVVIPSIKVKLIEIRLRKSECLKQISSKSALKNIEVQNTGIEKLKGFKMEHQLWFKGFMPGDRLIEFLDKGFPTGIKSKLILMKGPAWPEEKRKALSLKKIRDYWKKRFECAIEEPYSLPDGAGQRILVVV